MLESKIQFLATLRFSYRLQFEACALPICPSDLIVSHARSEDSDCMKNGVVLIIKIIVVLATIEKTIQSMQLFRGSIHVCLVWS